MKHRPSEIGSRNLWFLGICLICGSWPGFVRGDKPLLELTTGTKTYVGRSLVHSQKQVWLEGRDGQINRIALADVTNFRRISSTFRPWSAADVRAELRRELGNGFAIVGTGQYLVCGRPSDVDRYARVFDEASRTFRGYCSVRNLGTDQKPSAPEFPLVAIVFPTRDEFVRYAAAEGFQAGRGVLGYYNIESNRVALYDPDDGSLSWNESNRTPSATASLSRINAARGSGLPTSLEGVLIHESTHQMAFNMGLHSRIGENPQWVVEGLATVFEAPGIRNNSPRQPVNARVNQGRLDWFREYAKKRRPTKSLETFLESDAQFQTAPYDAYSQAWALTFFLVETRPAEYGAFLRSMAERNPLKPLTKTERLEIFRDSFGKDVVLLEAAFLRFVEKLP